MANFRHGSPAQRNPNSSSSLEGQINGDSSLFRLSTQQLSTGMYVHALDRPWSDTPFGSAEFMVVDPSQVDALRTYCREVVVDVTQSLPDRALSIKIAAAVHNTSTNAAFPLVAIPPKEQTFGSNGGQNLNVEPQTLTTSSEPERRPFSRPLRSEREKPSPRGKSPKMRNDVRLKDSAKKRVRSLMTPSLASKETALSTALPTFTRLKAWIQTPSSSPGRQTAALHEDRPALQCSLEKLQQIWKDPRIGAGTPSKQREIDEVLSRFRPVYAATFEGYQRAKHQIRSAKSFSLEDLRKVVKPFAASVITCNKAMFWLETMHSQLIHSPGHIPSPSALAVAMYTASFGTALGLPSRNICDLALMGLISDLGKLLIPKKILEHPGILEPHETALLQQHVPIGLDLIRRAGKAPPEVIEGVLQHHERLDGSGYPQGISGSEIGLYGRILAIVDSFVALTSPRPYAKALPAEEALAALSGWSSKFDADLLEHFIPCIGIYPVGTLVEQTTGEVAVVLGVENGKHKLLPLTDSAKRPAPQMPSGRRPLALLEGLVQVFNRKTPRIAKGLPTGAFDLYIPDYYARLPTASGSAAVFYSTMPDEIDD